LDLDFKYFLIIYLWVAWAEMFLQCLAENLLRRNDIINFQKHLHDLSGEA